MEETVVAANEVMECIRGRRSVRRFRGDPVEPAVIDLLVEAARWAPSNHNRQAWKLVVVRDPMLVQDMRGAVDRRLDGLGAVSDVLTPAHRAEMARSALVFAGAPVVIAMAHRRPNAVALACLEGIPRAAEISGELLSSAMAVQNLLLAAHASGLGACVLTAPLVAADELLALLQLQPSHDLTCLVALGYPDESPTPPRRKRIDQVSIVRESST